MPLPTVRIFWQRPVTLIVVALVGMTGLMGGLWAQGGGTTLAITPGGVGGSGQPATIVQLTPDTFTIGKGNAQVIQGLELYEVVNIAPELLNSLILRFYILNPQDMGGIFTNPNAFVTVEVGDMLDPETVWATALLNREGAVRSLSLVDVPFGTTSVKVRASLTVPGGRPPGAQQQTIGTLETRLEVSQR